MKCETTSTNRPEYYRFHRLRTLVSGLLLGGILHTVVPLPATALAAGLPQPLTGTGARWDGAQSPVVTNGTDMVINQTADRATLHWNEFNVDAGNSVTFNQPSSSSVALNRIFDANPSTINGALSANGRIYLINTNGMLFGPNAVVNTNSLIASTLDVDDQVYEQIGIVNAINESSGALAAFDNFGNPMGEITIENGAQLTAGQNGRIMIFAPKITNDGTISTPDGQAVLAAAQDQVYLAASTDPDLRGLLVEVRTGGSVTNTGQIIAERGNASLVGLAVNQQGTVRATTSVALNGSVRLVARDMNGVANIQGTAGSRQPVAGRGGDVVLGGNSVTGVTPDPGSPAATDAQGQSESRVVLEGTKVKLESGASVAATGGNVDITAAVNPVNPRLITPGDPTQTAAGVVIESGASIDVSGDETTQVSVARNVIDVEARGNELADAPLQRNGAIRNATLRVDVRKGTGFLDTKGAASSIERSVGERLSGGGTIDIRSEGNVSIAQGAALDIGGGKVTYTGDIIRTSKLTTADGRLVDISDADPDHLYTGVLDSALTPGQFEAGYVEGKDAGTLNITARGLDFAGSLVAGAARGRYQRNATGALGGLNSYARPFDQQPLGGALNIGLLGSGLPTLYIGSSGGLPGIELAADLLGTSGLSSAALSNAGRIVVNDDIRLQDRGSLSLTGTAVDVGADVRIAGGSVTLKGSNSTVGVNVVPNDAVAVTVDGTLDVSGAWINDLAPAGSVQPGVLVRDGGDINIASAGDVVLGAGSLLDASAGASLDAGGRFRGGAGGRISLESGTATDPSVNGSRLAIGGELRGYGFQQGGRLALTTEQIRIEQGTGNPAGAPVLDDRFFTLQNQPVGGIDRFVMSIAADAFEAGGFQSWMLNTTRGGIALAPGVDVNLTAASRVLATGGLPPARITSGTPMADITAAAVLPDYLRAPLDLVLASANDFTQLPPGAAGVDIGTGAAIHGEAGATISLEADTSIRVDGTLDAPAGRIDLALRGSQGSFGPSQQIWLGDQARLLATGAERLDAPNAQGLRRGQVLDGGRITLSAEQGSIVGLPGAVIDVDAAAAPLDVDNGIATVRRTVAGAAGRIDLSVAESLLYTGTLSGQAALPGTPGGELNITLNPRTRALGPLLGTTTAARGPHVAVFEDYTGPLPVFGQPVDATLPGTAFVPVSQIGSGGFDALGVEVRSSSEGTSSAGIPVPDTPASLPVIEFTGDTALDLGRSVVLDAAVLRSDDADVSISAPYVALGSADTRLRIDGSVPDKTGSTNPQDTTTPIRLTPTAGTGKLTVQGDLIELVGELATEGIGSAGSGTPGVELLSSGDVRLRGVRVERSNRFDGLFRTAGDLRIEAQQVWPVTLTDFALAVEGSGGTLEIAQAAGRAGPPLSVGGSLALLAEHIVQGGTVIAPLGTLTFDADGTLVLADGSLTSTSGAGLSAPFLVTEPGGGLVLPDPAQTQLVFVDEVTNPVYERALPQQGIALTSPDVDVRSGARIDLRAGGDEITALKDSSNGLELGTAVIDPVTGQPAGITYVDAATGRTLTLVTLDPDTGQVVDIFYREPVTGKQVVRIDPLTGAASIRDFSRDQGDVVSETTVGALGYAFTLDSNGQVTGLVDQATGQQIGDVLLGAMIATDNNPADSIDPTGNIVALSPTVDASGNVFDAGGTRIGVLHSANADPNAIQLDIRPVAITDSATQRQLVMFDPATGNVLEIYDRQAGAIVPETSVADLGYEFIRAIGATEFLPGPGGSRDILLADLDPGSGVAANPAFAIVPGVTAFAPWDPLASPAAQQVQGVGIGEVLTLEEGTAGLPAGQYAILPARYALFGGYLVTPVDGTRDLVAGAGLTQADGTPVLAGRLGYAGGTAASRSSGFAVIDGAGVRQRAQYRETSLEDIARDSGARAPGDAGNLAIDAGNSLSLKGQLVQGVAGHGRGSELDIATAGLLSVVAQSGSGGGVELLASDLAQLGADSLLLGGRRSLTVDGTLIRPTASDVVVEPGVQLSVAELLLTGDAVTVSALPGQATTLAASGTDGQGDTFVVSGDAALLAVSNRELVQKRTAQGGQATSTLTVDSGVTLGATGSLVLDAEGDVNFGGTINARGATLALGSSGISLGETGGQSISRGLVLSNSELQSLAGSRLRLRSSDLITVYGAITDATGSGNILFDQLALDAVAIVGAANSGRDATLAANSLVLSNSSGTLAPAAPAAPNAGTLNLVANDITLAGGRLALQGYSQVNAAAGQTLLLGGDGGLSVDAALSIDTPVIAAARRVQADITASDAPLAVTGGSAAAALPAGLPALGTQLALAGSSIDFDGRIVLPAGSVTLTQTAAAPLTGDLTLGSNATIDVAGRMLDYGITQTGTGGGRIALEAQSGAVTVNDGATLDVSAALQAGQAGTLAISAPQGAVDVAPAAVLLANDAGQGSGVFRLDAAQLVGSLPDPLDAVNTILEAGGFHDRREIRLRTGDIQLAAGSTLTAQQLQLTADSGRIDIQGVLDASGRDGGSIRLAAADDITITGTLDAHATDIDGDGGDVTLTTLDSDADDAGGQQDVVNLAAGSSVDVSGGANGKGGTLTIHTRRLDTNNDGQTDALATGALNGTVTGAGQARIVATRVVSDPHFDPTTGASTISATDISQWKAETAAFMNALPAPSAGFNVVAGLQVESQGDLLLNSVWDFNNGWRYGVDLSDPLNPDPGVAGVLALRAAGDVQINADLTDAFVAGNILGLPVERLTGPVNRLDAAGNVVEVIAPPSWSYRIAAGADLTSADVLAVNAGAGDLQVAAGRRIRTGTGDIHLAAGNDVALGNTAAVYTAGYDRGASQDMNAALAGTGITGDEFMAILLNNGQLPAGGGNLSIYSGGNILAAGQQGLPSTWQPRVGEAAPGGANSVSALFGAVPTHWGIAFERFTDGVGTLGGGDVTIEAAGDVDNLSVALPTSGRAVSGIQSQVQGGFVTFLAANEQTEITGGGQLRMTVGGDMTGTSVHLGAGRALISAGGRSGLDAAGRGSRIYVGSNAQLDWQSADGMAVSAIADPTTVALSDTQLAILKAVTQNPSLQVSFLDNAFFTYGDDTTVNLRTLGGDLLLSGTGFTGQMPSNLIAASLGGNLDIRDIAFTLFPSPVGQLTLLAGNDITGSISQFIRQSDQDRSLLPGIASPESLQGVLLHAAIPVHLGDPQRNLIVARDGSIQADTSGGYWSLDLAKATDMYAGRDIRNVSLKIQHNNPEDISTVFAGRDITQETLRLNSGRFNADDRRKFEIAGPGNAFLIAGRRIALGTSSGVETVGNISNTALPDGGADLTLIAGAGGGMPAYAAFRQGYIDNLAGNLAPFVGPVDSYLQLMHVSAYLQQQGVVPSPSPVMTFLRLLDQDAALLKGMRDEARQLAGLGSQGDPSGLLALLDTAAVLIDANAVDASHVAELQALRDLVGQHAGLSAAQFTREFATLANDLCLNACQLKSALLAANPGARVDYDTFIRFAQPFGLTSDDLAARGLVFDPNDPALAFAALSEVEQRPLLDAVFFNELKESGIAADANTGSTPGDYSRGFAAISALFPTREPAGGVSLLLSQVKTVDGGSIGMLLPGGDINAGAANADIIDKDPADLGIVALRDGDIDIFVDGDLLVNSTRVFALQGDLLAWSTNGNIDAGKGAKTVASIPDPITRIDPNTGQSIVEFPPAVAGSGIKAVNAYLFTPRGVIDAGDAGIETQESLFTGAVAILNASNIQAAVQIGTGSTTTTSIPLPDSASAAAAKTAEAVATSSVDEQDKAHEQARQLGLLSVEVLGFGECDKDDEECMKRRHR